jgi:hypothetical protein
LVADVAALAETSAAVATSCDQLASDLGAEPSAQDDAPQSCQTSGAAIDALLTSNPQSSYSCDGLVNCSLDSATVSCMSADAPSAEVDQLVAALEVRQPALIVACCVLFGSLPDDIDAHIDCVATVEAAEDSCAEPFASALGEFVSNFEALVSACVSALQWGGA